MVDRRRASIALAVLLIGVGAIAGIAGIALASAGPRTVHVSIHYSRFDPTAFDVRPGETVRFVVTNLDPIEHEFIIGDVRVQLLHERGAEAFHPPRPGEMTVPAGTTMETTYTFPSEPGSLILGCHLPGHYAYGMHAPIRIG
jgi:uncharacterized cupredoxin-like copper-binding protein